MDTCREYGTSVTSTTRFLEGQGYYHSITYYRVGRLKGGVTFCTTVHKYKNIRTLLRSGRIAHDREPFCVLTQTAFAVACSLLLAICVEIYFSDITTQYINFISCRVSRLFFYLGHPWIDGPQIHGSAQVHLQRALNFGTESFAGPVLRHRFDPQDRIAPAVS